MVHLEKKYHLSQISNWNVGICLRGCLLHYISQTNSVGRRPSPLTWPTFCATRCQGFMKLFKPSLHLILGLPQLLVCPWGIQNLMRVVQRLPVLLTTWPVQFHLSLLIINFHCDLFLWFFFWESIRKWVGMSESLHRQRCRAAGGCEAPQTKSWVSRPHLNGLVPKKTLLRVNYNTCDISDFIALIFCPQRGLNNYLRSIMKQDRLNNCLLIRPFQILLGNFLATFKILSNFFVREQLLTTFRKTSTFLVTFGLFWT